MQILRLLAARRFRGRRRRAVSTITATTAPCTPRVFYGEEEDEGPFFDLDLSCCSAPASTAGSQAAESGSESEGAAGDLDFVISLHRSRSASPSYEERLFFRGVAPPPPPPLPLKFCASEPSHHHHHASSSRRYSVSSSGASRRSSKVQLRTLSFGGRVSFSRSSSISARRFAFAASPDHDEASRTLSSGDVFRRYLSKISSRLRKSRSAPVAAAHHNQSPPPARRDDTLVEKQDGIASAIAHCKESFHRGTHSSCAPKGGRRCLDATDRSLICPPKKYY
ncbi:hypothetical protein PR202_ga10446 [Eleusine coracana subsp. coracana]|uniref:Uncharacterized protein n=1 Tax=Eleusine coracana subsp. coracana TaxID=191504 RepID=A0AAV5C6R4_ELECO|nr:hypothetical protein PR202_ga10446 [Eleusine coracana subsp. coracana]